MWLVAKVRTGAGYVRPRNRSQSIAQHASQCQENGCGRTVRCVRGVSVLMALRNNVRHIVRRACEACERALLVLTLW